MLQKRVHRLINWQIQKGMLQEDQRAIYEYAYEVLISKCINSVIVVLVAWLFDAWLIAAALIAIYIPLRTYAGGYHAESNLGCMLLSTLITCGVCYMAKNYNTNIIPFFNVFSGILSIEFMWKFAPVAAAHKPLDEVERKHCKVRARIICLIGIALGWIMHYVGAVQIGFTVFLAQFIFSVMLLIGHVKGEEMG